MAATKVSSGPSAVFRLDSSLKESGTVDGPGALSMKSYDKDQNSCSVRLAELGGLPAPALRRIWQDLIGSAPATGLRRELLIPILAYKLQEKAYGGLKPSTRTHLRRLAASLAADKSAPFIRESRFKPGTRLIREWRGETHEVTIRASGYEYHGKEFTTLSEIANLITGTRWSGPLFFGIKASKRSKK
jgi:Protein of unknown function (DUF2924)